MSTTIINLIGGSNKSKFPSIQGSEYSVNMYTEKNGKISYLKSVPGLRAMTFLEENIKTGCQGSYVSSVGLNETGGNPDAFFVCNNKVYRYGWNEQQQVIGTVTSNSHPVFCETGGERPLLLIADGYQLQYYNLREGGTLHQISLPDKINESGVKIRPSYVQCVSGSIIVNDVGSGYVYYSIPYPLSQETRNVYDIVGGVVQYEGLKIKTKSVQSDEYVFLDDYGVPQYKNAESNSDSVEALYTIGSNLIVFGPSTVEFWQRGSSEYETWTRTSYTFNREIGLDARYSISSVNNRVCFVSNGTNSGKGIFMIDGTSFTKISDTWLDEILDNSDTSNAIGFSYSRSNHSFYCLYLPSVRDKFGRVSDRTFCYDIMTNEWSERSSRDVKQNRDKGWNCIYPIWYKDKTIFGHTKDGWLVCLDDSLHVEQLTHTDSIPLVRQRQSSVIMDNYKPYMIEEISVELNCGSIKNYDVDPKLILDISEDGGNSFTNTIHESCGRKGDYDFRCRFMGLGMNRLGVIRLSFTEDSDLVLSNVSIRLEPLFYEI